MFLNPKTTIAAIVGLIAMVIAQFGIQVSTDVQLAIVTVIVFAIGLFAGDGNKPKNA